MKKRKLKICVFLLYGIGLTGLYAQESIPASGGSGSGSGGSMSYTVGQAVYTTNTGSNGSVAQGVQQPFEISVVNGIKETKGISLQCSVYPNPTIDFITLKVEDYKVQQISYQLFDVIGNLLENKNVESNVTSIEMKNLAPSTYFLKVFDNQKEVKTFKIIKN